MGRNDICRNSWQHGEAFTNSNVWGSTHLTKLNDDIRRSSWHESSTYLTKLNDDIITLEGSGLEIKVSTATEESWTISSKWWIEALSIITTEQGLVPLNGFKIDSRLSVLQSLQTPHHWRYPHWCRHLQLQTKSSWWLHWFASLQLEAGVLRVCIHGYCNRKLSSKLLKIGQWCSAGLILSHLAIRAWKDQWQFCNHKLCPPFITSLNCNTPKDLPSHSKVVNGSTDCRRVHFHACNFL